MDVNEWMDAWLEIAAVVNAFLGAFCLSAQRYIMDATTPLHNFNLLFIPCMC